MKTKSNHLLFALVLVFILVTASLIYFPSRKPTDYKKGESKQIDDIVEQAKLLYRQKQIEGMNFSSGPCLSDDVEEGWVVDVVHDPRQSIDNRSENQCLDYESGKAKHFVELDLEGEVVRVQ